MRWYADRYTQRTGLHVKVRTAGVEAGGQLPREIETASFRIVQEVLTNVVRHAHAMRVRIAVTHGRSRVRVVITDNGVGFDPRALQQTSPAYGFGLQSMAERAQPETACVARAAFSKGNRSLRLADAVVTLCTDEAFRALFPTPGPPAQPPWRLALVTILPTEGQ